MRVLVSSDETELREDDYRWTLDGELLTEPGVLCDDPHKRYVSCGCGRGFGGVASARATTVGVVREMNEADVRLVAESAWANVSWRKHMTEAELFEQTWSWFTWLDTRLGDEPVGTVVRVRHDLDEARGIETELLIDD